MRHPPFLAGWIDREHQECSIGDLVLESGKTLLDCHLTWVEHGSRNAEGNNTVLACCAIGSSHHRLDFLIGEGKALDPSRLHIIVIDALGNGLSNSPSNSLLQSGALFPAITIRDMVQSQYCLLQLLEITQLHCVIGASMGGMQALQWAVSYPDFVNSVIAMTPMARTSRWSQLVNELSRRALFIDKACTRARSLEDAKQLWPVLTQLITPLTPARIENFPSQDDLLGHITELENQFLESSPDPFDWLAQTRAYDAHDLGGIARFGGNTNAALASIAAPTLVLAPPLDLYNPSECAQAAAAIIPGAQFIEIPSIYGHRSAAGADKEAANFINHVIVDFLAKI
jgi:homoserine O-acetyltransferase